MSDIRLEVVVVDDDLGTMVAARDAETGEILAVGVDSPDGQADESAFPYVGCSVLLALALPYTSHPDFREEWRA